MKKLTLVADHFFLVDVLLHSSLEAFPIVDVSGEVKANSSKQNVSRAFPIFHYVDDGAAQIELPFIGIFLRRTGKKGSNTVLWAANDEYCWHQINQLLYYLFKVFFFVHKFKYFKGGH